MMKLQMFVAAIGFFVLQGCGLLGAITGGGSAHCDFRAGSSTPRCQERLNTVSASIFKDACKTSKGEAGDGACPTANIVGGCDLGKQGDGSSVTDWYYAPMTVDQVKAECDSSEPFLPAP